MKLLNARHKSRNLFSDDKKLTTQAANNIDSFQNDPSSVYTAT